MVPTMPTMTHTSQIHQPPTNPLQSLRPTSCPTIRSLVELAGCDTRGWTANDSYGWAFENRLSVVLTLWWDGMKTDREGLYYEENYRNVIAHSPNPGQRIRALKADTLITKSLRNNKPIRAVIVDGVRGVGETASVCTARDLDMVDWIVTYYNPTTGDFGLRRKTDGLTQKINCELF